MKTFTYQELGKAFHSKVVKITGDSAPSAGATDVSAERFVPETIHASPARMNSHPRKVRMSANIRNLD